MAETFTQEEVGVVQKTLQDMRGTLVGVLTTRDNCISSFVLNVLCLASDESEMGIAQVNLSDGTIGQAMKIVHDRAVAAHGGDPGDEGYPQALDPQAAWSAAKTRFTELIADPAVPTLEAVAEQMVSLLANAGPADQKWGRAMLLHAFRTQVK